MESDQLTTESGSKPLVGVSACLLGDQVRFDGGHKHFDFLTGSASRWLDYQKLCPEVDIGLGTPRPSIQLNRTTGSVKLVENRNPANDHTEQMEQYAHDRIESLGGLHGFIFKKNSPSCGLYRVPVVINQHNMRERDGTGLFAAAFIRRWPQIPVEEEGRLNDARLRENFFEALFAYWRWNSVPDEAKELNWLLKFHANHKYQLMAHGGSGYRELGRLLARCHKREIAVYRQQYIEQFMTNLKHLPNRRQQMNVLQHLQGYFKKVLSHDDKRELEQIFQAYKRREIPLITPVTLLRHYVRKYSETYLATQYYLNPFPDDLALRSNL